jgi:hypothetical protein
VGELIARDRDGRHRWYVFNAYGTWSAGIPKDFRPNSRRYSTWSTPGKAPGDTRHEAIAADLQHDAIDARVFSGIHSRTADEVAIAIGAQVANWALDHHFAPAN